MSALNVQWKLVQLSLLNIPPFTRSIENLIAIMRDSVAVADSRLKLNHVTLEELQKVQFIIGWPCIFPAFLQEMEMLETYSYVC